MLKTEPSLKPHKFDVVVNIESSHCYTNMDAFFYGVNLLLSDDGVFIFADFRPQCEIAHLEHILTSHFEIKRKEDIRRHVL